MPDGTRFQVLAPVVRGRKGEYQSLLDELAGQGFARARIDGEMHELSDPPKLARYELHTIEVVVDRLVKRDGIERRLTDSLETALKLAEGVAEVQLVPRMKGEPRPRRCSTFCQHLACPVDGRSFDELAPRNFSFNSPYGACPTCDGLGTRSRSTPNSWCPTTSCPSMAAPSLPGPVAAASTSCGCSRRSPTARVFAKTTRWKQLKKADQKAILYGSGTKKVHVQYRNRYGRVRTYDTNYEGVPWLTPAATPRRSPTTSREMIEGYMREAPCPACGGARPQAGEPGRHRRGPQHLRNPRDSSPPAGCDHCR